MQLGIRLGITRRGGGGVVTRILDHYTGTDATNVNGRLPDIGAAARVDIGTAQITGNRLQFTALTAGTGVVSYDVVNADQTLTVTFNFGGGGANGCGAILRLVDSSNFLLADVTSSNIKIYTCIAGVFTAVATTAIATGAGDHTLAFSAIGNALTATVDGAGTTTFTSSQFNTATRAGAKSGNTLHRHDDLQVIA